jgi:hypothetical protein
MNSNIEQLQYILTNYEQVQYILKTYLKKKADFETVYHTYITKKTNIENIMKYTDPFENNLISPYKKYIDDQLNIIKELYNEYNNLKTEILNIKNIIKPNVTIFTDLLNEIDNSLLNKSSDTIFDINDNILKNIEDGPFENIAGFSKNEYSSINDNNFFYWEGPFGVLVPNHIDKVQSIYSNIHLTKEGQLIIKDNQIKEGVFVYDKETYLKNFAKAFNGLYIYNDN